MSTLQGCLLCLLAGGAVRERRSSAVRQGNMGEWALLSTYTGPVSFCILDELLMSPTLSAFSVGR